MELEIKNESNSPIKTIESNKSINVWSVGLSPASNWAFIKVFVLCAIIYFIYLILL